MKITPRASFNGLPTEIVAIIIKYAAKPTFTQDEGYEPTHLYATARKLCLVSRIFRHLALPIMLHTVVLDFENMTAFLRALRMQNEYAQTYPALRFEYTPHVRNIWIGPCLDECPSDAPVDSSFTSEPVSDLELIAPVLLGASSLAIYFSCLNLLTSCIELAWTRMDQNIDNGSLPLPWNTKTLTLSRMSCDSWEMTKLASGSAFLASITHFIALPPDENDALVHILLRTERIIGPQNYAMPLWMSYVPWNSFERLERVSLVFPRVQLPFDMVKYRRRAEQHAEVLTLPGSMVKGRRGPAEIRGSKGTEEGSSSLQDDDAAVSGEDFISLNDVHVAVSDHPVPFCGCDMCLHSDWQKVWASGLQAKGRWVL
ncbi:uncharacterized protein HD556DRAFT_1002952 [Suillus plorans]|uniref:F-box domain-containing protein n=1 Tax=Suillus plorans TaxID=116603 RepID=A0A9P7AF27_9AGAM|nr:uncharacterized protein HD556DRAFT_1002952 [Suillus plorans]KAG1787026.1 hypothetical protein HD556DRAFT_1002952 [Suillus plorans]